MMDVWKLLVLFLIGCVMHLVPRKHRKEFAPIAQEALKVVGLIRGRH